jgi:cyanophycinase
MSPAERAQGDQTQPSETGRRRRPDPGGVLMLIGGGTTPDGDALKTFLQLADGARSGPIVGFTTASGDPGGMAALWSDQLTLAGAREFRIPIVGSRADAHDPQIIELVRRARGIFLGGGDQVKLVTVFSGTPLEAAIREAYERGAVICGTSAGAAALSETTLAGNEVDEEGNLVEQYIGPGLGLLGFGALIDTHFSQRRRLYRLFVAIAAYPQLMGLGIDEDTALIVRGHMGTVVGRGGVTFVDARGVKFDNSEEVTKGRQLTLSSLRVGIVGTGYEFNLRERELQIVLEGAEVPIATAKESVSKAGRRSERHEERSGSANK